MTNRFTSVLACAAWLIAGAVHAQPAAPASPQAASPSPPNGQSDPPAVSGVTVEARSKASVQAFSKAVGEFVQEQGRPGMNGQVSRWRKPLCPRTIGLTPAFDDFVTQRLQSVAGEVGLSKDACSQGIDVLVVFTTKPDQLMADIRDHHPQMLGFHEPGARKALARFEPPMKSWYVTLTRQGERIKIDWDFGGLFPDLQPHGGGHFPPTFFSDFGFALIVVDSNQMEGQEIGAVADRIALLALSKPSGRDGCSALPSIMDVLDPKCPSGGSIKGLTTYDEAYLKALYSYSGDETRAFERASIAKSIIKDTSSAPQGSADAAGR